MARRRWLSPAHAVALGLLRDAFKAGCGIDPDDPKSYIDGRTVRAFVNRDWAFWEPEPKEGDTSHSLLYPTENGLEALRRYGAEESIEDLIPDSGA